MRCKSHPGVYGAGVCASCLRERLLALIAAQNESFVNYNYCSWRSDPPRPLPLQPALVFHRSVSPYVAHRRSVGSDASPGHSRLRHRYQWFFSTPQVGPTFSAASGCDRLREIDGGRTRRFSILRTLFGHRMSEEAEPALGAPEISASGSWFSGLILGRWKKKKKKKKKKSQLWSAAEEEAPPPWRAVKSGMSPAMENEDVSGYSSDEWRRSNLRPKRQFAANHGAVGAAVSGFSVCLSPPVSIGSEARRSQPAEPGFSGDLRSPGNLIPHRNLPVGAALARHRSR
ncbi:transposon protein [Musa troglodytarum]|uniref:Transposon protein n=1 Tax=Musa troglodytarum TaxID=320322 RepID=A0A9E7KUS8_9LILI|nr:transposon protein [Musa troglodytarum]